jgi:hypothetical protein
MAASGFTPIQLYYSATSTNVPLAANLAFGELAINIVDGKMYYKNSSNVVTKIADAATATGSVSGGTAGAIVYQSAPNVSTFLNIGTNGFLVTASGGVPVYTNPASLTVGSANTATHVAGGAANQIVYQQGAGATVFAVAPTVPGTVLGWSGTTFTWVTAPAAVSATNLSGGVAGEVPYQSGVGVTSFTAVGTPGYLLASAGSGTPIWTNPASLTVSSATTATTAGTSTNLAGGVASQIPYQSAAGTTAFLPNGVAGQVLQSNGTSAPSWIDTSTLSTSNGKLYFFGQF